MSTWDKLKSYAVLVRLHNCVIAAASVLIGSFLAHAGITGRSVAGGCVAFFICAGGYALNDICDIETDSVNKPWRPLPSGRIGRRGSVLMLAACWGAGLAFSAFAGPAAAVFAALWVALIWLYSHRLKSGGAAGHILVSAVSSSGFILGGLLGGDVAAGLLPFCIATAFHFAREVAKAFADLRGDSRTGIRTLAVRTGERHTGMLCAGSIAAAMALSILPFAAGVYGVLYMVPVVAIQPLLALCIYLVVASRREGAAATEPYGRVATILKAVMPVGLLAFLLGGM